MTKRSLFLSVFVFFASSLLVLPEASLAASAADKRYFSRVLAFEVSRGDHLLLRWTGELGKLHLDHCVTRKLQGSFCEPLVPEGVSLSALDSLSEAVLTALEELFVHLEERVPRSILLSWRKEQIQRDMALIDTWWRQIAEMGLFEWLYSQDSRPSVSPAFHRMESFEDLKEALSWALNQPSSSPAQEEEDPAEEAGDLLAQIGI